MNLRLALFLPAFLITMATLGEVAGAREAGQAEVGPAGESRAGASLKVDFEKDIPGSPRISEQKAVEIVSKAFPDLDWEVGPPDISLDHDNYLNKMTWRINLHGRKPYRPAPPAGFHAVVDAGTGEILNFYRRGTPGAGSEKILTREEARLVAENLARRLQPVRFGLMRPEAEPRPGFIPGDFLNIAYHFAWLRMANGLKINSDGIRVTVDALSGTVTGYNFQWQEDLDLPETAEVMPVKDLSQKLIREAGMILCYHVVRFLSFGAALSTAAESSSQVTPSWGLKSLPPSPARSSSPLASPM